MQPPSDYVPAAAAPGTGSHVPLPPAGVSPGDAVADASALRFRDAFTALVAEAYADPAPGPKLVQVCDLHRDSRFYPKVILSEDQPWILPGRPTYFLHLPDS